MALLFSLLSLTVMSCVFGAVTRNRDGVQAKASKSIKGELNDNTKTVKYEDWNFEDPEPLVKTMYFYENGGHRMAVVTWKNNLGKKDIVDCDLYGDKLIIDKILKDISEDEITSIDKNYMSKLVGSCTSVLMSSKYSETPRTKGEMLFSPNVRGGSFLDALIFPGTKWCGPGNIADGYDDLGPSSEADTCCRAHDHCNDTLNPTDAKYGLINKGLYSKSHCDCDTEFAKCLSTAGTKTAKSIGIVFFNIVQMRCFKNDHPIIKCLWYKGLPFIHRSCQQYLLDTKKPLKWQFFDAKYYQMPD